MKPVQTINHGLRKSLMIGILEFSIADIIHSFKRPATFDEISSVADESPEDVRFIVQNLIPLDYVKIAPRSGKVEVTDLWKRLTKPVKQEKEINPMTTRLKAVMMDESRAVNRTDYVWSGYEHRLLSEFGDKIRFSNRVKMGSEPSDDQVCELFATILDNLGNYHVENFSLSLLNTDYNNVLVGVRRNMKEAPQSKAVKNAVNIRQASNEIVIKTARDYQ